MQRQILAKERVYEDWILQITEIPKFIVIFTYARHVNTHINSTYTQDICRKDVSFKLERVSSRRKESVNIEDAS